MANNNRIEWIDIAKFIGIILVIFGHMETYNYSQINDEKYFLIKQFIFTFHMPLFLFLSGFVTKKKSILNTINDGIKQLIIPYVMYSFLMIFYYLILSIIKKSFSLNNNVIRPLLGIFMGYSCSFADMLNGPLWFLLSLFFCKLLYSSLSDRKIFRYIELLLILIIGVFLTSYKIELPLSLSTVFITFWFYYLGIIVRYSILDKCIRGGAQHRLICFFVGVILMVMTFFISKYTSIVDINHLIIGNFIFFMISSLLGICGICLISYAIKKMPKKLMVISTNTLLIMAIHILIISSLKKVINLLDFQYNSVVYIFLTIITLFVCYFIIQIKEVFYDKKRNNIYCN